MGSDRDSLRREMLAGFLRSRRARLDPEDLGIYSHRTAASPAFAAKKWPSSPTSG